MAGALQLWETLKEAIVVYTGLSPATFFTVLAVAVAFYQVVSGFFKAPGVHAVRVREVPEVKPLPPPVQLGEITEEELKAYDGSDPTKPLLMAIKAQIYDVSQSRYAAPNVCCIIDCRSTAPDLPFVALISPKPS